MQVHYLEVVSQDVNKTCEAYSKLYDIAFSGPTPELGNARIANLANAEIMGVRAPMHESETPVVRPYMLVENIEQAITEIANSGGELIHPATDIPGRGMFAVYILGGVQYGLWQL